MVNLLKSLSKGFFNNVFTLIAIVSPYRAYNQKFWRLDICHILSYRSQYYGKEIASNTF